MCIREVLPRDMRIYINWDFFFFYRESNRRVLYPIGMWLFMLVRSSLWHLNILCSCLKLRCQSKCSVSNRGLLIKILKFDFTDIWPFPVYAFVESLLEILGSHYGNHVSIALFNWIWNVCLYSHSSYSLQENNIV